MIIYFKNLFNNLKLLSLSKKILFVFFTLLYLTIIAFSVIKVNYSVMTPGTPSRVDSVITVETDNEVGRIYTVSIFEYRHVSLLHYLLSKTSNDVATPDFDPSKEVPNRIDNIQGDIMKEISVNNAIVMAYVEASNNHESVLIDFEIEGYYIYQLTDNADERLKIKDLITHIDNQKIESIDDISKIIEGKTTIKMTVRRDEEIIDFDLQLDNDGKIGISIYTAPLYKINQTIPKYQIDEAAMATSRGPSGGLMQALAIYNAITPLDITRGKTIMGTGTIDVNGNVGPIGGVAQKVYVADNYGADIFFVPSGDNYNDAKAQYDKIKNPKFVLIEVNSFANAINYLEGLGG